MSSVWLCSYYRTPFTRATKGALAGTRADDLLATAFRRVLSTISDVGREEIDDVIAGIAYPEAELGRNVARAIVLASGLPDRVPAMTLTRLCASSLEAIAVAAAKIRSGQAHAVLVGGVESLSRVPMGGLSPSPNPAWRERRSEIYMTMGETAECVAERFHLSRAEQDTYALRSHWRAGAARERGIFAEEIVPVETLDAGGAPRVVAQDDAIRTDTSLEKLAALQPAFFENGSVTAGNSCPTTDGASAMLVASDEALRRFGVTPLGRVVSYAVAGVAPEIMGVGPVEAVPIALRRAGRSLGDMDRIELNEAFASQVIAVIRALELPEEQLNVNGGAIALGHPLGATGARLAGTLLRELARSNGRYGLATLCIGGGMGAAMVVESAV
jgi:acetyl-CoA acyltransferase